MDIAKLSRHAAADQMQAARDRLCGAYFDGPPALASEDEAERARFHRTWLANAQATIAMLDTKIIDLRSN